MPEKHLELEKSLKKHNQAYFNQDDPEITDSEYDSLKQELRAIYTQNPEKKPENSVLNTVGSDPSESQNRQKITHTEPMLSLDNLFNVQDFEKFLEKIQKTLKIKDVPLHFEAKTDGLSVSLIYEKGELIQAATRGDGTIGELVTDNARTLKTIPQTIDYQPRIEIRGEIYLDRKDLDKMNQDPNRRRTYANPRNAAAGSFRLKDPVECATRPLKFHFHGWAGEIPKSCTTQEKMINFLTKLGFPPPITYTGTGSKVYQEIQDQRDKIPYDIDGLVVKVASLEQQESLGNHSTAPRWAAAWKFPSREIPAVIREITIQIGRSGILAPVAELEPVYLDGTTISRATLHNKEFITSKDIREGDTVGLQRAGDVIPQILSVDLSKRKKSSVPYVFPNTCPACGAPAEQVPGKAVVRCSQGQDCQEQRISYLTYFCGKKAFDLEGASEGKIRDLVIGGFLETPSDFFVLHLKENKLKTRSRWGATSVRKLLESIEQSKNIPLDKFLRSFGIDGLGSSHCRKLAKEYYDWPSFWDNMQRMQDPQDQAHHRIFVIEGIGKILVQNIYDYFQNPENISEIERLLELGVNPQALQTVQGKETRTMTENSTKLSGNIFVFTGKLQLGSRDEAGALAETHGGRFSSSLSAKTDYLVVGEKAGSKLAKAEKLGVTVLSESEFLEMIQ